MKRLARISAFGCVLAAAVVASAVVSARVAEAPPVQAGPLVDQIQQAVARARVNEATDPQEESVVTWVADVIVTANVEPKTALEAVRLAIAKENCVYETTNWNRWGCSGLANVASTIEQAIATGPGSTGGGGNLPTPVPSVTTGGGSGDYRPAIGV